MSYLGIGYLAIGCAAAVAAAAYLVGGYRTNVLEPAKALHGRVAVAEDLLTFVGLSVVLVVAWLPLAIAFGVIKGRRLLTRDRARENNPTPTL
jgi:hypothetical protein